jgi:hypothetical protein
VAACVRACESDDGSVAFVSRSTEAREGRSTEKNYARLLVEKKKGKKYTEKLDVVSRTNLQKGLHTTCLLRHARMEAARKRSTTNVTLPLWITHKFVGRFTLV